MTTKTSSQRLEVHILSAGVGQGESIVLRLPNGKWGVVDCYARSPDDPQTNPTIRFLKHKNQNVTELEFLCLTHPHDDHYRGMSQILQHFPVRCFWRWGGMSNEELKWIVKVNRKRVERLYDEHFKDKTEPDNASELQTIFSLVCKARSKKKNPLIQKRVSPGSPLYPVPVDSHSNFQILGLAPSGNQVERYEQTLKRCFTEDGALENKFDHSAHNMVSAALLVIFGQTQIVLGGDVEKAGWADVIEELGKDQLNAHAVKVSHHGSTNGYTDRLWGYFSAKGKPVAVITPYRASGHPQPDAIQHIRQHANPILVTHARSVAKPGVPVEEAADMDLETSVLLHTEFQGAFARESDLFGRCTLVFDDQGNMKKLEFPPPAGRIQT